MVTYEEPSKELSEKCTNSLVEEPPVRNKVCTVGAQYNNCTVNVFSGAQGHQLMYPPMAFPPAMSRSLQSLSSILYAISSQSILTFNNIV